MNVEEVQWHRLECLESGTVIVEFKDGAYDSNCTTVLGI